MRGIHNAQHRVAEHFLPLFLKLISKKYSIPTPLTKFISPLEIANGNISTEVLKKRLNFYALVTINKEIFILTGDEIKSAINNIISENKIDASDEIRGEISFSGKASGKVKIVNTVEDMKKVNDGDILVSVMTRTNLIYF